MHMCAGEWGRHKFTVRPLQELLLFLVHRPHQVFYWAVFVATHITRMRTNHTHTLQAEWE